jgi:hypothetical protein
VRTMRLGDGCCWAHVIACVSWCLMWRSLLPVGLAGIASPLWLLTMILVLWSLLRRVRWQRRWL